MSAPAPSKARPALRARALLLFALVNSLALPLLLLRLPAPPRGQGVLRETYGQLLGLRQEGDSWGPMLQAFDYASREEQPLPLYEKIFFTRRVKFQYPPAALLPFWLMDPLLPRAAWPAALNAASLLFLTLSVAVSAALLRRALRAAGGADGPRVLLLGVWLALGFYPLVKAYSLGQIQAWVNGLFALALACWLSARPRAAGALVGLMCLIKPHYGLFALWGALRRRWSFVLALGLVAGLGLLSSLAVYGLENHRDYLDVVSFMSRRGEAYFPNQSLNGLLNRLLRNGNNLEWKGASFAPYHPWVFWSTAATSALLMLAALAPAPRRAPAEGVDFSLLALTVTVASPIAWEHHYGILPPIYAAALGWLAAQPVLGRATLPALALSYALASNFYQVANRLAATDWNVFQSHLYFGALLLLFILHRLRLAPAARARS